MKVLQILEQIDTAYRKRHSDKNFNDFRGDRMRDKFMSDNEKSGFAGRVYSSGDPHSLNKINYDPVKDIDDGYMVYIKHLVDTGLYNENPYAPRVYKMDVIEDARGKSKYKIQIEKLAKMDSVDQRIVINILTRLFDLEQVEYVAERIPFAVNDPVRLLAKCIECVADQEFESKDPLLNKLCDTIHDLDKKHKLEIDIHGSNIMLRLGKTPQVVIVDPLA